MFRSRLQGYFSARKLCRLWVLECFDGAIARGEPFVKWVDRVDPSLQHNGINIFAHYMTIKYITIHEPEMSVLFDRDGAFTSSSDAFRKLQAYIWTHRFVLARRCQDMLKSKFATQSHSRQAWQPLNTWLFANPALTQRRVQRLTRFDKSDRDLFRVVGKCMWRVAQGENKPWGVAAKRPSGYAVIRKTSKVCTLRMTAYARGLYIFFFIHFTIVTPHVNIPYHYSHLTCTYDVHIRCSHMMLTTGLGLRDGRPTVSGEGTVYEHAQVRQGYMVSTQEAVPPLPEVRKVLP